MPAVHDFGHGISAIDSGLGRPLHAAIHLLVEDGRAAIIDTGSGHSVPHVLQVLAARGIAPECVDYVILTHVHLDHASGAGRFMQVFPNALLAVHPRGARHMADPSVLVASAQAVYGAQTVRRTYGELLPVPRARIVETPHQHVIRLAGRELVFLDTPGHARHHAAIWDVRSRGIFSGDTFGLAPVEFAGDGRRHVFPTTSPTQFDPEAAHRSVNLMLEFRPERIFVTHYSEVRDLARLAADLRRLIDSHRDLALRERDAGAARGARLREGVDRLLREEVVRQGCAADMALLVEVFAVDIELNAAGLECWLDATSG